MGDEGVHLLASDSPREAPEAAGHVELTPLTKFNVMPHKLKRIDLHFYQAFKFRTTKLS